MHTTIDYSRYEGDAKHAAAMADVLDWFGLEKFNEVISNFKEMERPELDQFRCWMGLGGVQGYPVVALWNHIWNGDEKLRSAESGQAEA